MSNLLKIWRKNSKQFKEISKKNRFQQFIEILYYRFHGFSALSYYGIPLYTELGKRSLISEAEYTKAEKYLNPRRSGVVPFNKWIQSCVWKANGLPHSNTLGFFNKRIGVLNGATVNLSEDTLTSFFSNVNFPVVIKPIDGANGIGFDVIEKYESQYNTITMRKQGTLSIGSFMSFLFDDLENLEGYILQEYIVQHPDLSTFHEHSVNSLRVVTFMNQDNNYTVDCALMKFGAGKSITDNDSVGGRVFAFMDMNNGSLGKGFTGSLSQRQIEFHPDSHFRIFQYIVPFWKESLELAIAAHKLIPYPSHLGWDIAISKEGPIIIEPNSFLAIPVYQKGGNDMSSTGLGRFCKEFIRGA